MAEIGKDIVPYGGDRPPVDSDPGKDVAVFRSDEKSLSTIDHDDILVRPGKTFSTDLVPFKPDNKDLVKAEPAKTTDLDIIRSTTTDLELKDKKDAKEEDDELSDDILDTIVIAGLDRNIRARAKDAARDRLNEELKYNKTGGNIAKKTAGLVKHMGKLIWKGNWAREVYLHRYEREAAQTIIDRGDIYEDNSYVDPIVDRFASDYERRVIHHSAGERQLILRAETGNAKEQEIRTRIIDFVKTDVAGGFATPEARNEAKKLMMAEMVRDGLLDGHEIDSTQIFADNLDKFSPIIKAKLGLAELDEKLDIPDDINERVDKLFENTKIVLGEAMVGARGEARATRTDKILDRMGSREGLVAKALPWFNETTIGTAAAIAAAVSKWGQDRAIGGVIGRLIPGAAAALIVAAKESERLSNESEYLGRRLAEGMDTTELLGRAGNLMGHDIERSKASDLTDWLRAGYDKSGNMTFADAAALSEYMARMGNIQAHIDITDSTSIGKERNILGFSSKIPAEQEQERTTLDVQLAKSEIDLADFLASQSDAQLAALGFDPAEIGNIRADSAAFATERVAAIRDTFVESHEKMIETANSETKLYRAARTAKMAGIAGGVSILLGASVGEAVATFTSTEGLFEAGTGTPHGETVLDRAYEVIAGDEPRVETTTESTTGPYTYTEISKNAGVNLPEGFTVNADQATHAFSVTGPNNLQLDNLQLSAGGLMDQETIAKIEQAGIKVNAEIGAPVIETVQVEQEVSMSDFAERHTGEATQIKHNGWLDNNTAKIFDKNEQGLNSPFRQEDGQVRLDIDRMTENGSYHNGKSVNWIEQSKNGNMQITVYTDKAHYHEGHTFKIDENGRALIPTDHPVQQLFSDEAYGRVNFSGLYIEAQFIESVDADGTQHVWTLATEVGDKSKTVTDIVQQDVPREVTTYNFELPKPTTVTGPDFIDLPYTIPIVGRSGLDTKKTGPKPTSPTPTPGGQKPRQPLAPPSRPGAGSIAKRPTTTTPPRQITATPRRTTTSPAGIKAKAITAAQQPQSPNKPAALKPPQAAPPPTTGAPTIPGGTPVPPNSTTIGPSTTLPSTTPPASAPTSTPPLPPPSQSTPNIKREANLENGAPKEFYDSWTDDTNPETRQFPFELNRDIFPRGLGAAQERLQSERLMRASKLLWYIIDNNPKLDPRNFAAGSAEFEQAKKRILRLAAKISHTDSLASVGIPETPELKDAIGYTNQAISAIKK